MNIDNRHAMRDQVKTLNDARYLIVGSTDSMGRGRRERPRPRTRLRSPKRAHMAGSAGRSDGDQSVIQMAGPENLARIDHSVERLGWARDRYEMWLLSSVSPAGAKEKPAIRTAAEANKASWALKNLPKRSGKGCPQPHKRPRQARRSSVWALAGA